jgi:hypothetical protein
MVPLMDLIIQVFDDHGFIINNLKNGEDKIHTTSSVDFLAASFLLFFPDEAPPPHRIKEEEPTTL